MLLKGRRNVIERPSRGTGTSGLARGLKDIKKIIKRIKKKTSHFFHSKRASFFYSFSLKILEFSVSETSSKREESKLFKTNALIKKEFK